MHSKAEAANNVDAARKRGLTVGLVPTMGALHEGHLSLIRRARFECGYTAVSIFVNPTQFGPGEDLDRYPRTLEVDVRQCESEGVDIVFAPSAEEMYPQGFDTWVDPGRLGEILEGASRPGHFRGVATVCAKLFNIIAPDRAYFGLKDYQQLKVIQQMVRDLDMRTVIIPVEIVREPDGLAMSSRNSYLTPPERAAATVLFRALQEARNAFESGERDVRSIQELVAKYINTEPAAEIDYVAVVDAETLELMENVDRPAAVLLAVKIGQTRLIDNTVLNPGGCG